MWTIDFTRSVLFAASGPRSLSGSRRATSGSYAFDAGMAKTAAGVLGMFRWQSRSSRLDDSHCDGAVAC